jgi:1-acyl-sn-glycerol-3-phosphate acyltransferase
MWIASIVLIVVWYPAMVVRRLFDRDPALYATGRLFRDLGVALTKVNPLWRVKVFGVERIQNPRNPYVVVSNHQSMADIPVLSHLPWEMKWMAKKELFSVPFVGWELKLAGDIRVDRDNPRDAVQSIRRARAYLDERCSVMVFPEGTRSRDGDMGPFLDGAFRLAVDAGVPILPVVVEGTFDCLPKKSWKFGKATGIRVEVLDPIPTDRMKRSDIADLRDRTRMAIADRLDELRGPATAPLA